MTVRKILGRRSLEILAHVALSRLLFLGGSVLGARLVATPFYNHDIALPDPGDLWRLAQASAIHYGDFNWYRMVAVEGYQQTAYVDGVQANWAFFPLFPIILAAITSPVAMFIVPQILFAASCLMLHRYLRETTDVRTARAAVLLLIYFPFSYVGSQFRPEAFLLPLTVGAVALAHADRRWLAAGAGLLAGFAKPNAFLTSLLLLRYFPGVLTRRPRWNSASGLAMLVAPGVGVLAMCAIMQARTGDAMAWAKVQGAWGAEFIGAPLREIHSLLDQPLLVGRGGWDPLLLNWLVFAAAIAATVVLIRRRRWDWAAFTLLYAGLSFSNHAVFVMGKYMMTCFPVFVGLAGLVRGRTRLALALIASAAALVSMAIFNGADMAFTKA